MTPRWMPMAVMVSLSIVVVDVDDGVFDECAERADDQSSGERGGEDGTAEDGFHHVPNATRRQVLVPVAM